MMARPRAPRMVLLAVLLVAAAARVAGIAFGLPHTLARPDEDRVLGGALNVARGHFDPQFFSYPSLFIYLVGALEWIYYAAGRMTGRFASLDNFVASWPVDYRPLWLVGRGLAAAFGTAAVWLVYRLGAAAFCRRTGLLAAFFLALAFLHVRDSHFAVTDVPMTTLAVAAVLLLVRALRLATVRAFASAGLVAGLAASTKYNALLLVVPGLCAALMMSTFAPGVRGVPGESRALRFGVFFVCLGAAFIAGTPFAVLDYRQFATDVAFEAEHLRAGHAIALGPGWQYHFAVSLKHGLGTPLLAAGLLGIPIAIWRNVRVSAVVFAFPAVYYVSAGTALTVFTRYMTPVIPFLCLSAGVFVDAVTRAVTTRVSGGASALAKGVSVAVAVAVAGLLVTPSALAVSAFDRLLARTDTRVLAARWIGGNAPAGNTIHQSGVHYGHVQLEVGGQPARYRHWGWDEHRRTFTENGRPTSGLPDWIVMQRSALIAYSPVPEAIEELVSSRYEQLARFAGTRESVRLVYDQQDAFYLPLSGLSAVSRPGPNLFVYRRSER